MNKKVGFNFFRSVIKKGDKDYLFSFKDILEIIRNEYLNVNNKIKSSLDSEEDKILYNYNNEPARLAQISLDVENKYYHLVFERLDYQLPNRTTLYGDSEALDLEDDEWIGLATNVLYDSENHIFMIQRNRASLGPLGIELFLRTIINDYIGQVEGNFSLPMVSDDTAKERAFNQKAYRKVNLKVTGLKANGIVEKFSKNKNKNVDSVEITFNCSTSRKDKIDDDFVIELLEEYVDSEEVQKLQIRSREEDDSLVEPIDLIDQKLQTFIDFKFGVSRQLNPAKAFESMTQKFNGEEGSGGFKEKVKRMWR